MVCWLLGGCAAIAVRAGDAGCGLPCKSVNTGVCTGRETGLWGALFSVLWGSSPAGLLLTAQVTPRSRVSPREQRTQLGNASLGVYGKGRDLMQPRTCICILSQPPGRGDTHPSCGDRAWGARHTPAPPRACGCRSQPRAGVDIGFCSVCPLHLLPARARQRPLVPGASCGAAALGRKGTRGGDVGVMWRCGVCAQEPPPCPPHGPGDRRVCQLPLPGHGPPGAGGGAGGPQCCGTGLGSPWLHRERPMGVGCFTSPHLGSGCREGLTKRL